MPAGYGIAQTDKGLLTWDWVTSQIEKARNYWICTTRPDGRPHAAPVWGLWLDDAVWFSTGRASRKARNLARDPSLVVHLESGDDTVILEGEAEEVSDPAALERFVDAYDEKYAFRPDPGEPANVTYSLRPRMAQTWREQ